MKHMVEDKINSRSTGPKKLLTRQPVEGRGDGGGLRIGEMERDVLVAHGISKFAHESLMDRSDGVEMLFDKEQGILDTSRDKIAMPYAMTLFIHELESMGVSVKVETM
jgi:DNA-directed RNA polymerase beta subunit